MVRIQIQLESAQHRLLKRQAKQLGVSTSEVVRRCVDAHFQAGASRRHDERIQRALSVAGRYVEPTGATRVSAEHDDALAEAYRR